MQSGGPIAFYEIAATLIPVLFLGGVVLDSMHPPDQEKLKGRQGKRSPMVLFLTVVYYLPVAGSLVILAEAIALDAVVSRTTDPFHALFVGITLLVGMVAVMAAVWVPWVLKFRSWASEERAMSPGLILGVAAIMVPLSLGALAVQPWVTSPLSELRRELETQPKRAQPQQAAARRYASEVVWLEHLIATSGFRADRLQVEKEHASSEAARLRASKHLRLQRRTQQRQREALEAVEDLIAGSK